MGQTTHLVMMGDHDLITAINQYFNTMQAMHIDCQEYNGGNRAYEIDAVALFAFKDWQDMEKGFLEWLSAETADGKPCDCAEYLILRKYQDEDWQILAQAEPLR